MKIAAAPAEMGESSGIGEIGRDEILAALDEVMDPEIPTASVVQLGMIGEVEVGPERIRVELLPTFVGCPAQELIRDAIAERLAGFAPEVRVEISFSTPWSSDRITREGRAQLERAGFAPPPHLGAGRTLPVLDLMRDPAAERTPCPYCGSARTTMLSAFGPTQCRTVHHCADCRQPFEGFKAV